MKILLMILTLMLASINVGAQVTPGLAGVIYVPSASSPTCSCVYTTTMTIDYTKCGTVDQSNFDVVYNDTVAGYKNIANGGHVYLTRNNFEVYINGDTSQLVNWWIEKYDSTTGWIVVHCRMAVSHTVNTKFYMRYGMTWVDHAGGRNSNPFTNNYIGFWPFSEATGSNNLDYSGNGYTLVPTGSGGTFPAQSNGQVDGALTFTAASNQYTGISDIAAMNTIANETIAFWFKRSSAGNVIKVGKTTSTYNMIEFWSDGNVYMSVTTNHYAFPTNAGDRGNDGNWHYVVMAYDGSQGTDATRLKYYLDGTQRTLTFVGNQDATTSTSLEFFVGKGEGTTYSNGSIDDVVVRSITMSADEVLINQNMKFSPFTFISVSAEGGPTN